MNGLASNLIPFPPPPDALRQRKDDIRPHSLRFYSFTTSSVFPILASEAVSQSIDGHRDISRSLSQDLTFNSFSKQEATHPCALLTTPKMKPRPVLALVSLILIAGALLLILLTFIAGGVNHNPTDLIYFLQADTSKIPGAPAISRWTFWNVCSVSTNGRNACGKVHPAFPLDPPSGRNFGTTKGVPTQFLGTRQYFYMTRFMFAFGLIGLFFATCSLFLGLFALCSRIGSYFSSALCSMALFFQTITAALMTAAYVKGRNNFRSNNLTATIGSYSFGFMWAATVCLFLATVMFCVAGVTSKRADATYAKKTHGRTFFGMRKNKRDRGSFIDSESQRRVVKDEYS